MTGAGAAGAGQALIPPNTPHASRVTGSRQTRRHLVVKVRVGAVVAGTAAMALALAACSTSAKTPTPAASSATGFNAAVTSIVNPSTKQGGVLKLANSSDI